MKYLIATILGMLCLNTPTANAYVLSKKAYPIKCKFDGADAYIFTIQANGTLEVSGQESTLIVRNACGSDLPTKILCTYKAYGKISLMTFLFQQYSIFNENGKRYRKYDDFNFDQTTDNWWETGFANGSCIGPDND